MKVAKVFKACHSRVGDCSEFLWSCYPTALSLGLYDKDTNSLGSVTYNYKSGKVYEVTVEIDENTGFRWINPKFVQAYNDECKTKNVDATEAWDGVKWIDVDKQVIINLLVARYNKEYIDVSKYQHFAESESTSEVTSSVVHKITIVEKHEFEVKAQTMVDSIDRAKQFISAMSPPVSISNSVTLNGSTIISESVERRYNFPESESTEDQQTTRYMVNLLVSYEVDVSDNDMTSAVVLAKNFVDTIRPAFSWPAGVVWLDSYVTSETVERKTSNV